MITTIKMERQPLIRIFSIGSDCHYGIRGDLRQVHEYTKDFSDLGELAAAIVTSTVLWIESDPADQD